MNGRIYDPLIGRFLSADIASDGTATIQGYNRYSYVHNNPLASVDPSGCSLIDNAMASMNAANENVWNSSISLDSNSIESDSADSELTLEQSLERFHLFANAFPDPTFSQIESADWNAQMAAAFLLWNSYASWIGAWWSANIATSANKALIRNRFDEHHKAAMLTAWSLRMKIPSLYYNGAKENDAIIQQFIAGGNNIQ